MKIDIIVPITFIVSIFGIIYLLITSRHRERLSMIKMGIPASAMENKSKRLANTLKTGMLCIGIGIGIVVGFLINNSINRPENPIFYFASIFLFGGISLILNYRMEKNRKDRF